MSVIEADNIHEFVPDPSTDAFANFELPERYRVEDTTPYMVFADYSSEANDALAAVQAKAAEWLGGYAAERQNGGDMFSLSKTLFLSAAQREDLGKIVEGTPLEFHSVRDFADAIERGVQGKSPRVESTEPRQSLGILDHAVNAGHAMREFAIGGDIPWERERALACV